MFRRDVGLIFNSDGFTHCKERSSLSMVDLELVFVFTLFDPVTIKRSNRSNQEGAKTIASLVYQTLERPRPKDAATSKGN